MATIETMVRLMRRGRRSCVVATVYVILIVACINWLVTAVAVRSIAQKQNVQEHASSKSRREIKTVTDRTIKPFPARETDTPPPEQPVTSINRKDTTTTRTWTSAWTNRYTNSETSELRWSRTEARIVLTHGPQPAANSGAPPVKHLDLQSANQMLLNPPAQITATANAPPVYVPRRIVHFDLKGAQPKVEFLIEMFRLIKRAGATGVLIEWEDTFPYTGRFMNSTSLTAYTPRDVHRILGAARDLYLEIIPLVQTFGHLEWILKLDDFKHLRDTPAFSTVLCVAKDEAWDLLRDMIDQVLAVHQQYGLDHVHVGMDEVFQFGVCAETQSKMSALNGSMERFMLWHMSRVAQHVKQRVNKRTVVLVWHDMIANTPPVNKFQELAAESDIHALVEPVIWNYAENIEMYMAPEVWDNLKPFRVVWGSSAYKGADGPMRYHANPVHYVRNQLSWLRQIAEHAKTFDEFRGMVVSGWSRYDHFAVLTELHPVAVPALVMSLIAITAAIPDINSPHFSTFSKEVVGCQMTPQLGPINQCSPELFPGHGVFQKVQQLRLLRMELANGINSDADPGFEFNGWLGRMNQAQRFSSAWYLQKLLPVLDEYVQRFKTLYKDLEFDLHQIYYDDTVAEWLYEYLGKDYEQLVKARKVASEIQQKDTFLRRPLPGIHPQLDYLRTIIET